jgi:hypothetical protein
MAMSVTKGGAWPLKTDSMGTPEVSTEDRSFAIVRWK